MLEESAYKLPEHGLILLRRYGSLFWDFVRPSTAPRKILLLFFSAGVKMATDTTMSQWVKVSSAFSFSFHNWIFVDTHGYCELKKCVFCFYLTALWFNSWGDQISKPMELLNSGTVEYHCQALAACLLEESDQPHIHSDFRSRQAPHRCSHRAPKLSLNSHSK